MGIQPSVLSIIKMTTTIFLVNKQGATSNRNGVQQLFSVGAAMLLYTTVWQQGSVSTEKKETDSLVATLSAIAPHSFFLFFFRFETKMLNLRDTALTMDERREHGTSTCPVFLAASMPCSSI